MSDVRNVRIGQSASGAVRVLVVTDSALMGEGLRYAASRALDFEVVDVAGFDDDLLARAQALRPDVVLACPRLPLVGAGVARALVSIYERLSETRFAFITDRGDECVISLLPQLGHRMAFLPHDQPGLLDALQGVIRQLMSGYSVFESREVEWLMRSRAVSSLTRRESEVLRQLARAATNRSIAGEMQISLKAVERYVTNIFRKMGLQPDSSLDRRVAAALLSIKFENPDSTIRLPRDLLSAGL